MRRTCCNLARIAAWQCPMAGKDLDGRDKPTERKLALTFLTRAEEFLPCTDLARIGHAANVCHAAAIAAELVLKAWLICRGWSDDRCRHELRHDLEAALESARASGLPARSTELTTILAVLNAYYRRHAFERFVAPGGEGEFHLRVRAVIAELIRVVRPVVEAFARGAPLCCQPDFRGGNRASGSPTLGPPGLGCPDGECAGDR